MSNNDNNNENNTTANTDEYEKVCYICRRSESKAGKMINILRWFMYVQIVCRRPLIQLITVISIMMTL